MFDTQHVDDTSLCKQSLTGSLLQNLTRGWSRESGGAMATNKYLLKLCKKIDEAYASKDQEAIARAIDKMKVSCVAAKEYDFLLLDETSVLFWYECNRDK